MSDNYLIHFKYKRKEKINGKWVYYYDDGSTSATNHTPQNVKTTTKHINTTMSHKPPTVKTTTYSTTYSTTDTSHLFTRKNKKEAKAAMQHGLFSIGKKTSSTDHKYVAKVQNGKNTRYFYSLAEFKAFKNPLANVKKQVDAKVDQAKTKVTATADKAKGTATRVKNAFTDKNMYNSTKWNYDRQKERVQKTDEWKAIVKRKDPEYTYRDKEGKVKYDYDSYLMNKKHPVLDIAQDLMYGRKTSINKVSVESLAAGVKDYHTMAVNTVNNILMIGGAILMTKIKNNQGSFEDDKRELQKKVNDYSSAGTAAVDALNQYYKTSNTVNDMNRVKDTVKEQAQNYKDTGSVDINEALKTVPSVDRLSKEAISSYAKSRGITEAEAKEEIAKKARESLNAKR